MFAGKRLINEIPLIAGDRCHLGLELLFSICRGQNLEPGNAFWFFVEREREILFVATFLAETGCVEIRKL